MKPTVPTPSFRPFSLPPAPSTTASLITCPYITCMAQMLSSQFTNHVLTSHVSNRDQQYLCPLCAGPGT